MWIVNVKTKHIFLCAVFWDVTQCGSCKNPSLREMYRLPLRGEKNLVPGNVVPSSLLVFTLNMEVIRSCKTYALIRATVCHTSQKTASSELKENQTKYCDW
jgi:hypothetical protein